MISSKLQDARFHCWRPVRCRLATLRLRAGSRAARLEVRRGWEALKRDGGVRGAWLVRHVLTLKLLIPLLQVTVFLLLTCILVESLNPTRM